jgi:drug/metabolite transporter (DMT)-like permease
MRHGFGVSLFDIRPSIRVTFFFRVFFICMAYIFHMLAITYTSSFVYIALIMCLLPLLSKVVQRNAMIEKNLTLLDMISFGISVAGLVFLYRGNEHYTSNLTENYNNGLAYLFGLISLSCWSLATYLLHKQ